MAPGPYCRGMSLRFYTVLRGIRSVWREGPFLLYYPRTYVSGGFKGYRCGLSGAFFLTFSSFLPYRDSSTRLSVIVGASLPVILRVVSSLLPNTSPLAEPPSFTLYGPRYRLSIFSKLLSGTPLRFSRLVVFSLSAACCFVLGVFSPPPVSQIFAPRATS